jgi:hypothetical protein
MKTQIFVMPAWIAGIQVCGMSGDIRVGLDSSTPCWNDAIGILLELTETHAAWYFSKEGTKFTKKKVLDGPLLPPLFEKERPGEICVRQRFVTDELDCDTISKERKKLVRVSSKIRQQTAAGNHAAPQ